MAKTRTKGEKLRGGDGGVTTALFKISGMHCTACSMNIDLDLEETKGIINSKTNYARSISEITYDPRIITPPEIVKTIKSTGYDAQII